MTFGNVSADGREPDAKEVLNVLIIYDTVLAGQRGMRLSRNLAGQQQGGVEFRPQLWRLDVVSDPACGGFAIADAIAADLLIMSIGSRAGFSEAAQQWLRFCLVQKRGTSAAIVALLGTDDQLNAADCLNHQLLQSAAKEAGLEFFAAFANSKGVFADLRARGDQAPAPAAADDAAAAVARQIAQAQPPAMLRAYGEDVNYPQCRTSF